MSTKFGHNACNVKLIVNVISLLFLTQILGWSDPLVCAEKS